MRTIHDKSIIWILLGIAILYAILVGIASLPDFRSIDNNKFFPNIAIGVIILPIASIGFYFLYITIISIIYKIIIKNILYFFIKKYFMQNILINLSIKILMISIFIAKTTFRKAIIHTFSYYCILCAVSIPSLGNGNIFDLTRLLIIPISLPITLLFVIINDCDFSGWSGECGRHISNYILMPIFIPLVFLMIWLLVDGLQRSKINNNTNEPNESINS